MNYLCMVFYIQPFHKYMHIMLSISCIQYASGQTNLSFVPCFMENRRTTSRCYSGEDGIFALLLLNTESVFLCN